MSLERVIEINLGIVYLHHLRQYCLTGSFVKSNNVQDNTVYQILSIVNTSDRRHIL